MQSKPNLKKLDLNKIRSTRARFSTKCYPDGSAELMIDDQVVAIWGRSMQGINTSELQAYLMRHNRMSQLQAQGWLDEYTPGWRTKAAEKPVGLIEYVKDKDDDN